MSNFGKNIINSLSDFKPPKGVTSFEAGITLHFFYKHLSQIGLVGAIGRPCDIDSSIHVGKCCYWWVTVSENGVLVADNLFG